MKEQENIRSATAGLETDEASVKAEPPKTMAVKNLVRRLRLAAGGGAFPIELASAAADAIQQMQHIVVGATAIADIAGIDHRASRIKSLVNGMYINLPLKSSSRRHSDDLTDPEYLRLRALNRRLLECERWIREHRDRSLADYFKAGGVKRKTYSDQLWEDVETEVKVTCILREDHPDFDPEDDNFVAELRWMSFRGIVDDPETHNWNAFQFTPGHRFSEDHHCYLFHDLYDHVLVNEWDRILDIGGVWIDVSLVQQRGISWSDTAKP